MMNGLTFEEFASLAGLKDFREMALENWARILADPALSDSMKFEMISESRREGKSTNMLIEAVVASQENNVTILVRSKREKLLLIDMLVKMLRTADIGYVVTHRNSVVRWNRLEEEHTILFITMTHVQQRFMDRGSVVFVDA